MVEFNLATLRGPAREYFERVQSYLMGARADSYHVLTPDSPEMAAWLRYFDKALGWRPHGLTMMLDKQSKAMTVPAQWPQWFDPAFTDDGDDRGVKREPEPYRGPRTLPDDYGVVNSKFNPEHCDQLVRKHLLRDGDRAGFYEAMRKRGWAAYVEKIHCPEGLLGLWSDRSKQQRLEAAE